MTSPRRRKAAPWQRARRALQRLWQRSQRRPRQRRVEKSRARFWAELREGEREAEARRVPEPTGSG